MRGLLIISFTFDRIGNEKDRKTVVFVSLVTIVATITGMIFGAIVE